MAKSSNAQIFKYILLNINSGTIFFCFPLNIIVTKKVCYYSHILNKIFFKFCNIANYCVFSNQAVNIILILKTIFNT